MVHNVASRGRLHCPRRSYPPPDPSHARLEVSFRRSNCSPIRRHASGYFAAPQGPAPSPADPCACRRAAPYLPTRSARFPAHRPLARPLPLLLEHKARWPRSGPSTGLLPVIQDRSDAAQAQSHEIEAQAWSNEPNRAEDQLETEESEALNSSRRRVRP